MISNMQKYLEACRQRQNEEKLDFTLFVKLNGAMGFSVSKAAEKAYLLYGEIEIQTPVNMGWLGLIPAFTTSTSWLGGCDMEWFVENREPFTHILGEEYCLFGHSESTAWGNVELLIAESGRLILETDYPLVDLGNQFDVAFYSFLLGKAGQSLDMVGPFK